VLLPACNYLWNNPYTFSDESSFIRIFNALKQATDSVNTVPDNVILVNVAYDRDLVDYCDEYGDTTGNIDITDRKKLLELFEYLATDSSYQYIVCDVFFDASLKTEYDSALFNLMSRIPHLVVPKHENGNEIPDALEQKAAYADYKVNILEGSLLKYQYRQNGKNSIPLFMWEELEKDRLKKHSFWYSINGKLVTNSIILDFQTKFQGAYNDNGKSNYLNLGSDLLKRLQNQEMPKDFFKNKIILIGDLTENDIHDTTAGPTPGILINYNAYQMLVQHKLDVSWWLVAWLFALFFIITWFAVSKIKIVDRLTQLLDKRQQKERRFKIVDKIVKIIEFLQTYIFKNDVVMLILSFLGISVVFLLFNLFVYWNWGRFIEILLCSTYFSLFKFAVDLFFIIKHNRNEKKNHCNNGGNSVLPESVGAGLAEDNIS
jgi:hypothetical protein